MKKDYAVLDSIKFTTSSKNQTVPHQGLTHSRKVRKTAQAIGL
jgi:hypothetical protein